MDIKPIRTEADHEAALAEVESLWQAPPGSPKSDRLEILATLVDAYKEKNHRVDPPGGKHLFTKLSQPTE